MQPHATPRMDVQKALATLKVGPRASREEVKAAYRRLALECHPDRGSSDGGRRFQAISEAYGVLKDGAAGAAAPQGRPGREESPAQRRPEPPGRRGPRGGGPSAGRPPEQDWSKYTSEFEESNPEFWKEYERKFWKEYERTVNADGRNGEYDRAREPRERPNLFVEVDPSLCIACQSCETIAPSVFSIDKKSNLNPKSRVINMRGAGLNKIMNAAETCPTKAISVDDTDAKRRLYPL